MKNCLLILVAFFTSSCLFAKCVLVTGGAGFIGSIVNQKLYENGYETIVLDNLSRGSQDAVRHGKFIKGDISDKHLLDQIFSSYPIDAVMHFAAFLDVGESMSDPLKYYGNNVASTIHLLEAMHEHHINVFIFSSSATIFGLPDCDAIDEKQPYHPINPYGESKLMVETILRDLSRAYGLRFCALRYFNAAGGDPHGLIKNHKTKESNLIPVLLRSLKKPNESLTIFGTDYPTKDGTCIRDYIHVDDLASAHILAMEKLCAGGPSCCYNLGNHKGYSVREVITAAEGVTHQKVNVIEGERRAGDPPFVIADSAKAKEELGWNPQYPSLEMMIEHAWKAMDN